MREFFASPLFGITLSIFAFECGVIVNRRLKTPLAHPYCVAVALIILVLKALGIPYEAYMQGGSVISLFLAPATAVLALTIYARLDVLRRNLLPVLAGAAAGSAVSVGSVLGLSRLFGLDRMLTLSLVPKSVTTPIAMAVSERLGANVPVTVAAVVVTGVMGAVAAPALAHLFRVQDDPVAAGLAIGTCSHAIGTSKAVELSETHGAMSSIAICVAGIFTAVITMFLG